jgi:glutamate racemase
VSIGVFDSGVGGLTVLQELRRRMPQQDFIYVGDTARVPYGRKPREMVEQFAREIARFLVRQNVEGIVVACNTASAAALPQLANEIPIPIWGVIDPGVEAARRLSPHGRVGVIATAGTIRAGAYQRKLESLGMNVWARACPMFVHLVEEGLAESPEAELLARFYLQDRPRIEALVLACTHYPLLKKVLAKVLGDDVHLVDSAEVTAEAVSSIFSSASAPGNGHIRHYVTGDVVAYRHTATVIGGVDGEIVPLLESTTKTPGRHSEGSRRSGDRLEPWRHRHFHERLRQFARHRLHRQHRSAWLGERAHQLSQTL